MIMPGVYFSSQNAAMLQKIFINWKRTENPIENPGNKFQSIIILVSDYNFLKKKAESKNDTLKLSSLKENKFILANNLNVKFSIPIYARKYSKDSMLSQLGFQVHNPKNNYCIYLKNQAEAENLDFLDKSKGCKACFETPEDTAKYMTMIQRSRNMEHLCSKLNKVYSVN